MNECFSYNLKPNSFEYYFCTLGGIEREELERESRFITFVIIIILDVCVCLFVCLMCVTKSMHYFLMLIFGDFHHGENGYMAVNSPVDPKQSPLSASSWDEFELSGPILSRICKLLDMASRLLSISSSFRS